MAKKNCGCGQDPCVTFGAESNLKTMTDKQLEDTWLREFGEFYTLNELEWVLGEKMEKYDDEMDLRTRLIYELDNYDGPESESIIYEQDVGGGISPFGGRAFDAPYAGSGSLFSVGSSDSLSGLSSKELTESSAIHGDFDSASLNYSGHQNLQVRAEDEDRKLVGWNIFLFYEDKDGNESRESWNIRNGIASQIDEEFNYLMEDYEAETFESMSWYDPGEDTNNLERAFRREYPRYTLDSSSMEYLIYQGGASNKFHIFFVAQDDGGQYHAFNAYGRIGYNPRIQYIGGPYSTSDSAEYAFKKKMGQKTKKGYRPYGAEGYGDVSAYTTIPYSWGTDSDYDEYIDEYDINQRVEEEVEQEVRGGNREGASSYGMTVSWEDPEDKDAYIERDIDVDYSWGAEGSEDIPQVELHNPVETGIKLSLGSMITVVGISALSGAVLGLLNRTMGDE